MAKIMKDQALAYAGMGLAVFPLRARDKRPATDNGCKAATTDMQQIESWWNRWPDANIGIATGSISGGLVVIDLDIDEEKENCRRHGQALRAGEAIISSTVIQR